MKSIRLKSPAKLNLYLRVTNKRKDGFHSILTLFERINLSDDIHFVRTPKNRLRIFCSHPGVPTGPRNLVYRAADALKKDFHIKEGLDIYIKKNIPVAAGLGGGSSNAATTLLGLNQLWNLSLSPEKLLGYARQIGSDVAFFLYDCRFAIGAGRGEKIEKIPLPAKLWHVVIMPKLKVYARDAYAGLGMKFKAGLPPTNLLTKYKQDVNILIRALKAKDLLSASECLVNDLETAVFRKHPVLLGIKAKLQQLDSKGVLLSGSGPAIFALAQSQSNAQLIKTKLSKYYKGVFTVCSL